MVIDIRKAFLYGRVSTKRQDEEGTSLTYPGRIVSSPRGRTWFHRAT